MQNDPQCRLPSNSRACPLCRSPDAGPFYQDKRRNFFRCTCCLLIFVPPEQFPSSAKEKAEYDLHRNSPEDEGYRRFLSRLFLPMREQLAPGSRGLDFGCGPGPTLSRMFEEAGFPMSLYDPFYANNPSALDKEYDFITASEVVEHLHNPQKELAGLWQCLRPGGLLGIMTKLALDRQAFQHWHYKNDLTHVHFFSRSTFEWLAEQWQAALTFADKDVILLTKKTP
jgi:SAM-dependent methyltransferase